MTSLTTRVEPVDAHDGKTLREWFDVERAAQALDRPDDAPPSWTEHRARLSAPWPGEERRVWVARAATGDVVGVASLGLPVLDNTDNANGDVLVAPAHRRRGLGRELLALLIEEARAVGRLRLGLEAHAPLAQLSPGWLFAQAAGAHLALAEIRSRLVVPGGHEQARGRLTTDAADASPGYDLVSWTGPTPEEWVPDIARLNGRMSTDIPLGDLHLTPTAYDAGRIRDRDAMLVARGIRLTVTAAKGPGGRLVAFTEIAVPAEVELFAHNWNTLVEADHRGRRLGMRIKLANLALVRQRFPQVRTIETYNAGSNAHMLAINVAMGYAPYSRLGEYELAL